MKLVLDKKHCNECGQCLKNCPNGLTSVKALGCVHCEEKPCVESCPRNAFFEASEGIYSIDKELCDGCGECISACTYGAIELVNGKAAKCDLCQENDFFLECLKSCPNNAISLKKTEREKRKIEKLLGWRVRKTKTGQKSIASGKLFEIREQRQGEKVFELKGFPDLTVQEARLVREVKEAFQKEGSEDIEGFLEGFCEERSLELGEEQQEYLLEVLELLIYSFGPIGQLLKEERIEEIAVIGLGEKKPVHVFDRAFGWLKTNLHLAEEKELINLVNRMARNSGRRLSLQTPKLNSVLPDGNRINASIAPVSFSGPNLTIRKFTEKPFTPLDLIKNKTVSLEAMAFLWMLMEIDSNVLIAGNTGSGKTSTMNALFSFAPKSERIIVAEETPEVRLPQSHLVKLKVVTEQGIGMQDLILESLRMRPDKILIGEIRSRNEVSAFIDTLLAGQGKGSYATFHAQSGAEALKRFNSFGVSDLDLTSIDLVLVQRRWTSIELNKGIKREQRKVTELSEIIEGKGIELNPLFEFDYKKGKLIKRNESKKVVQKFMHSYSLGKKGVEKELKKRKAFLRKRMHGDLSAKEFFGQVNGYGKTR